jgi:hypothetical protein
LERGLKPLSNGCLGIIIKINLTTNYQLLLNCNKVHRAQPTVYTLHTVLVIDLGVTVPHQSGLIATQPCVLPSTSSDKCLSFHI